LGVRVPPLLPAFLASVPCQRFPASASLPAKSLPAISIREFQTAISGCDAGIRIEKCNSGDKNFNSYYDYYHLPFLLPLGAVQEIRIV
jgi:hypothetical protein